MTRHLKTQQRERLKKDLSKAGYTHRGAASGLGVSYEHLNRVLNGHRQSERLLGRIRELIETTPAR